MVNNMCNVHVFPKGCTFEEINKDHPKENKQRLSIYPEFTISREPATIKWALQRLRGWQSSTGVGKGKCSGVPEIKAGNGLTRRGTFYVIGRGAYLLSPLDPKLEAGTKIREGISCWPSVGHLGPIVAEFWFPGLVAADCGSEFCVYSWSGRW